MKRPTKKARKAWMIEVAHDRHIEIVNGEMESNRSICAGHTSKIDLDGIERKRYGYERDILDELKYWDRRGKRKFGGS